MALDIYNPYKIKNKWFNIYLITWGALYKFHEDGRMEVSSVVGRDQF